MVFGFRDLQARNLAGRAVREAGYDCQGSGPTSTNEWAFLTVNEPDASRPIVAQLIHRTTPSASRLR